MYYCSWDNHHLFGSLTPSMTKWDDAFTSSAYRDFQMAQLMELAERYPGVGEWWVDIPKVLPRREGLRRLLCGAPRGAPQKLGNEAGIAPEPHSNLTSQLDRSVLTNRRESLAGQGEAWFLPSSSACTTTPWRAAANCLSTSDPTGVVCCRNETRLRFWPLAARSRDALRNRYLCRRSWTPGDDTPRPYRRPQTYSRFAAYQGPGNCASDVERGRNVRQGKNPTPPQCRGLPDGCRRTVFRRSRPACSTPKQGG